MFLSSQIFKSFQRNCISQKSPFVPTYKLHSPNWKTLTPLRGGFAAFASSTSPPSPTLKFPSQVGFLPHPAKVAKGGEDAYFIGTDGNSFGVADGVGGWSEVGVDPALYSRGLMESAKEGYDKFQKKDPLEILQYAYDKMSKAIRGSCTACIVVLNGETKKLNCANLGDSGFAIFRRSQDGTFKSTYKSKEQQHEFNFPFQLGEGSRDKPSHADKITVDIKAGDIITVGTDGLFDNLYDWQIANLLNKHLPSSPILRMEDIPPENVADIIAKSAQDIGKSKSVKSPFAEHAEQYNWNYQGGKLDDITVILSYAVHDTPRSKL